MPLTIVNDTLAETPRRSSWRWPWRSRPRPAGAAVGAAGHDHADRSHDNDNGGTIRFADERRLGGRERRGRQDHPHREPHRHEPGQRHHRGLRGDRRHRRHQPAARHAHLRRRPDLADAAGARSWPTRLAEADRTVAITLGNPVSLGGATGANAPVLGTVSRRPPPSSTTSRASSSASPTYSVTEGGTATITVTRTGGLTGTALANFATVQRHGRGRYPLHGDSGILTFGPSVTSRTFTVATTRRPRRDGPAHRQPAAHAEHRRLASARGAPRVLDHPGQRLRRCRAVRDGRRPRGRGRASSGSPSRGRARNLTGGVTVDWSRDRRHRDRR